MMPRGSSPDTGLARLAVEAFHEAEHRRDQEQKLRRLERAMVRLLTPRQERVLRLRFGEPAPTLREIGRQLGGLSVERVRQIEVRGLQALRRRYGPRDLTVPPFYWADKKPRPPQTPESIAKRVATRKATLAEYRARDAKAAARNRALRSIRIDDLAGACLAWQLFHVQSTRATFGVHLL